MGQAKRRGSYEQRVKQATMPSFIKELETHVENGRLKIRYDSTDLTSQQCGWVDGVIQQLESDSALGRYSQLENTRGFVFWGDSQDFSGSVVELAGDRLKTWPDYMRQCRDTFFARYWATTNQTVRLSEQYCDEITGNTQHQPIGTELADVPRHDYTNFAIAVAYMRQTMSLAQTHMGDLCPPEATPGHRLYNTDFIAKVREAVAGFGLHIECDWQPGRMITTRLEPADLQ